MRSKKKTRREAGFERYLQYKATTGCRCITLGECSGKRPKVSRESLQDAIDYFLALAARDA